MQEETIFRSKLPNIDIANLPIHSYCFENISQFSKRPCLINSSTGEVYNYEEVELTSRKVAHGLCSIGIGKGDTIMLLLPNSPQYVFAFLGASYAGALSTLANPLFTSAEIIKQATSSDTKLIITQACNVGKVRDYAMEKGIKLICIDEPLPSDQGYFCMQFSDLTRTKGPVNPIVEIHPDDVVALPYSSGTTGLPKGVMVTHKSLVTNIAQQVDGAEPHVDITCHDVMMCVLPLFHVYALNCILLCGLRVGATILLVQKFEIVSFFELIEKHKVTVGYFVPPIFLAIAKSPIVGNYDLSSLRLVTSAAAPLGKDLEDAVRIKFSNAEFGQGYGMTEAGHISSLCLVTKLKSNIRSGSCGTVLRNAEVKIIDTETGASLGHNKRGEILLRSDQVMKGYRKDSESTRNSIDENGWLHTGDIGFIDSDDQLFVVDRLKEIIKYKGFQVAPAELEDLLLNHPFIFDAAVVPMQDEQAGEIPVAFVVCSSGSIITEDEIKQFISKQVVFYKKICHVVFVDVIPKSASGKILRKNLRERLSANLSIHHHAA